MHEQTLVVSRNPERQNRVPSLQKKDFWFRKGSLSGGFILCVLSENRKIELLLSRDDVVFVVCASYSLNDTSPTHDTTDSV